MRRGKRRLALFMLFCALLTAAAPAAAAEGRALPLAPQPVLEEPAEDPGQAPLPGEEDAAAGEIPAESQGEGESQPEPPAPVEEFPKVEVPAETYQLVNVGFNNKSLYLYQSPSTGSKRLLLPFATERALVRETLANGWSRVILRGTEGYLPTRYLSQNYLPFYMDRDYTVDGVELKQNQHVYARERTAENEYICYTLDKPSLRLAVNGALLLTPQEYYEKNKERFTPVLLGREESYYSTSAAYAGRNTNLALGCQSVDGRIVLPAEYFSWCQHGGSGSKADGYQPATVFSSTGWDYGGGLCQVTTTLASAASHSGLYLAEVYRHSQPVTYLRPGMTEASIWHHSNIVYQHDFTFFNNRLNPVQIRAKAENGVVTAEIYELILPEETEAAPPEEEAQPGQGGAEAAAGE